MCKDKHLIIQIMCTFFKLIFINNIFISTVKSILITTYPTPAANNIIDKVNNTVLITKLLLLLTIERCTLSDYSTCTVY